MLKNYKSVTGLILHGGNVKSRIKLVSLLVLSILAVSVVLPTVAVANNTQLKIIVYSDGSIKPIAYNHYDYDAYRNTTVSITGSFNNGKFRVAEKGYNSEGGGVTGDMKISATLYLKDGVYWGAFALYVKSPQGTVQVNIPQATIVDKGDRYEVNVSGTAVWLIPESFDDFVNSIKNFGFNITYLEYSGGNGNYTIKFTGSIDKARLAEHSTFSIINSNIVFTYVNVDIEFSSSSVFIAFTIDGDVNDDRIVLPSNSSVTFIYGNMNAFSNVSTVEILPSEMKIYNVNSTDDVIEFFRIKPSGVNDPTTTLRLFANTLKGSSVTSIVLEPGDPYVSIPKTIVTPDELSSIVITVSQNTPSNTVTQPSPIPPTSTPSTAGASTPSPVAPNQSPQSSPLLYGGVLGAVIVVIVVVVLLVAKKK